MVVANDVASWGSRSWVVQIDELLASRDTTWWLRNGFMMVQMVIGQDLLLSIRLASCSFILSNIIKVSSLSISTTIVSVSTFDHVHEMHVRTAWAHSHSSMEVVVVCPTCDREINTSWGAIRCIGIVHTTVASYSTPWSSQLMIVHHLLRLCPTHVTVLWTSLTTATLMEVRVELLCRGDGATSSNSWQVLVL